MTITAKALEDNQRFCSHATHALASTANLGHYRRNDIALSATPPHFWHKNQPLASAILVKCHFDFRERTDADSVAHFKTMLRGHRPIYSLSFKSQFYGAIQLNHTLT
jgi:hypothetical protein